MEIREWIFGRHYYNNTPSLRIKILERTGIVKKVRFGFSSEPGSSWYRMMVNSHAFDMDTNTINGERAKLNSYTLKDGVHTICEDCNTIYALKVLCGDLTITTLDFCQSCGKGYYKSKEVWNVNVIQRN